MATQLPQGTVTVLLTDVEASTDIAHAHGDPSAHELLRLHRQIVRAAVARHDGHEVKSMGDGFMLAFASARNAVLCALEIQRELHAHNRRHPSQRIAVRMGLNTGEMIREEDDLFGSAIAAAERIMRKATGGEIMLSEQVRSVMGIAPDIELRERGRFRLKGFPERWRLYEAVWRDEGELQPAAALLEIERTPFIAREGECEVLRHAVRRAAEGEGSLLIISGEAGVGKTRLATHVLAEAGRQRMLAVAGRCYEDVGGATYAPFAEIFEAIASALSDAAVREAAGEWLADIARVMPAMRRYATDVAGELDAQASMQQYQVLVGVASFLERASAQRPMMLLLDDLQWSDEGTAQLLLHLARALPRMPVMIVGTLREPREDAKAPITKALAELQRHHLAEWIELTPFSGDGVRAMLAALSGREPPTQLCGAIAAETDGVAFFVEEVFKHLAEEQRLFEAGGEWLPAVRVGDVKLPRGVRVVIDLRLARLSDAARDAVTAAAVIGREFTLDLLERTSDPRDDALFDAIDECERAHIIRAVSADADTGFVFAHELVRHALLDGMAASERQRAHLRVAKALDELDARERAARAESLAYHYVAAGRFAEPARVIGALRLAADEAMSVSAHATADEHYRAALRMLDGHPEISARERAVVLHGYARAQYRLGQLDESARTLDSVLEIYREEGMTPEVTEALYLKAVVCTFQARALAALEYLAEAKESVIERSRLHGLIHALESQNLVQLRRYDEARKTIDAAKDVARALDDDTYLRVRLLIASGYQQLTTLELRGAAEDFAHVVATDGVEMHERMAATSRGAMALAWMGRFDEATAGASIAGEFFRNASDPYERALAAIPLATVAIAQGRFDDAITVADEAMSGTGDAPSRWITTGALPLMLQARYATGRTDEIGRIANLLTTGDGGRRTPFVVRLVECLAAASRGDPVALDDVIARRGPGRAVDMQTAVWEVLTAEIAIAERNVELATEVSEPLSELYGRGALFTPGWVTLLPRVLGACAIVRAHMEEGERLLRDALEIAMRCRAQAELASTHLEFAELYARRGAAGDAASAGSHLAEARRASSEIGAKMLGWRLQRLEEQLRP